MLACPRCGSSERRPGGKGCAECNRRGARAQAQRRRDRADVVLTAAARAYIAAFDEYLAVRKLGMPGDLRRARAAKGRALDALEGPLQ